MLRERVPPLRERDAVLRGDFDAPAEPVPDDLPAPDERLEAELADLARVEVDFFAVPVERVLFAAPPVDRFAAVERVPVDDLRAPLDRPEVLRDEDDPPDDPLLLLADPSIDHLPLITRCAASATASAMSEPSLVALDTTLLAACEALSAASSPASRIFLRAAGLAAIAAAAAVSPAASISLLIAALASLSIVSLDFEREDAEPEPVSEEPERDEAGFEELEREELLRVDFAIFSLPVFVEKTLNGRSGSLMMYAVQK